MRGPWLISAHAIERYCERIDRRATREQALEAMIAMAEGAHRVKALASGLALFRGPKPRRIRMRVDERTAPPMLVTVLAAHDGLHGKGTDHGQEEHEGTRR